MVEKRTEKDRGDRLAAALRDNLKRRKAQARAKVSRPGLSTAATPEEAKPSAPDATASKTPKNR